MAFAKKTTVKGKEYYDLVESFRSKGKPKHRFIAHLGTKKPSQMEMTMINLNLSGNDEFVVSKSWLSKEKIQEINLINKKAVKHLKEYSQIELENFNKRFNSDFIYNTNAIEGSKISREETELVLETGQAIEGKSMREMHEVENMRDAIKFINSYKGGVSEQFLKKLHSIVQKNIDDKTLGKYKRRPNYIGKHFPTHPIFVEKKMKKMLGWYCKNKEKFNVFELACIMHLKFVFIHPFTDGNGRIARLMHNFMLERDGYKPIIFSNSNKLAYYMAINQAHEKKPIPFLDYAVSEFKKTYERIP